jgi:RNA recognition motif-containing protein
MEEESAARNAIKELHGKYIPETGKRVNVTESSHPEGPSIPTITLHVKNIGPQVTAEKVRSLFQPYGLVVKCIILDPQIDALRKAVLVSSQLCIFSVTVNRH